jgi:hypothetical protein
MQNNEMNMVLKLIGILGVIFCLLALLLPWSDSSFTFGIFSDGYSTPFYVDLFTNEFFHSALGAGQVIFFAIVMIIIFILTIIALIFSINNVRNIGRVLPNKYLTLGILLIIDVILYIIAVSILSSGISTFGAYGIGFAMAIISAILFFMIYFLQKAFMPAVAPRITQQPIYQQPVYDQTQPSYQTPPQQTPHQHTPPPPQTPPQNTPPPAQQQPPTKPTSQKQSKATPNFCSQCAAPLGPNAKFCPQCGHKL